MDNLRSFDDFDLRLGDIMRGERATLGKSLLDVQRELKIRATYIAAIENADPTAFETAGFVAGYVRSYARYLGLDADWAYSEFCREGRFEVVHGMAAGTQGAAAKPFKAQGGAAPDPLGDPDALFVPRGEAMFSRIEPGAIGSILVLVALIGAIGYGGWSVLQEIQQVTLAPVEQSPDVVAEVAPQAELPTAETPPIEVAARSSPSTEDLDRLYRPKALEVPVITARDGPISMVEPGSIGALAGVSIAGSPTAAAGSPPTARASPSGTGSAETSDRVADAVREALGPAEVQVTEESKPDVVLLAVRPAWVRVRAADGTVLLQKTLKAGESYDVPETENPPTLRAGNSGSVFFMVGGKTYGPAKPGAQVVKNIVMESEALQQEFDVADLEVAPELARVVAELDSAAPRQ